MNVKERIIKLNMEHTGEEKDINELLITIISKYQLFEPCMYLSEDEEWLNVSMISVENEDISQSMSILKSEITAFGVFRKEDTNVIIPQVSAEDLYQ